MARQLTIPKSNSFERRLHLQNEKSQRKANPNSTQARKGRRMGAWAQHSSSEKSWLMGTCVLSRLRMGSSVETSAPFGKVLTHTRQWPAEPQRETSTAGRKRKSADSHSKTQIMHVSRGKSRCMLASRHGAAVGGSRPLRIHQVLSACNAIFVTSSGQACSNRTCKPTEADAKTTFRSLVSRTWTATPVVSRMV